MIIEKNNKCYRLIPNMKLGGMCDSWEEVNCTCQHCDKKQTCQFAFDDYNVGSACLKTACTCTYCKESGSCMFAFDTCNLEGDCLAEK